MRIDQITRRKSSLSAIAFIVAALAIGSCLAQSTGPIISEGAKFEEVSRAGKVFGEGVVAAKDGRVYLTEMHHKALVKGPNPGGTIYRYDPISGETVHFMEPSGNAVGLHVDKNGDLIICQEADDGGRVIRRNMTTGVTTVIADRYQGNHLVGPNDATSDAYGRIYFTDARYGPGEPMELPNAVYRIDPDGRITQLPVGIFRPNGIEVSADGKRLYVAANNATGRIPVNPNGPAQDRFGIKIGGVAVYDLDSDGNISNGRLFFRNDDLGVDGMAVDSDGNLYLAMHNGNGAEPKGDVVVLGPDGNMLQRIPLPKPVLSTNLGFGRGADTNSLYMSTARPWGLYRIKTLRRGHYFE
jgi:gluconolactonase